MLLMVFITGALVVMLCIAISNCAWFFPKLRPTNIPSHHTRVSILIPARNEAAVIGNTIAQIIAQTDKTYEIILLDDHSEDGTADIARAAAGEHINRLRVIHGQPLPIGWAGKNWACHQLAQAAHGDILVFTDADVNWNANALSATIGQLQATNADLLTVWPTQITVTPAERLIVPLMLLAVIGYLPIVGTHHTPFALFAAANGQCMVWRRSAYQTVGGHEAVKDTVLEDVTLARLVKSHGLKLRMVEGNNLITCRMYQDWPTVRDGFAKNILAGYGNRVPALLLATIFHWGLFILPWLLLLSGYQPIWSLTAGILGISLRAITAQYSGQRRRDALFMPLSVILMTYIALQSIYWHFTGGPRWKGRTIARQGSDSTWSKSSSSAPVSVD